MSTEHPLSGVYAAALTPLKPDATPDVAALPVFLDFLAQRGCHGALLHGTTGEGPSFAPSERLPLWQAALAVRQTHPNFRLLAGTGTPSLEETIGLTRAAFDLGLDGVVVLPPYYFRKVGAEGLFAWYAEVLRRAVPADGFLLGYHIPSLTGISLSLDLLARLKDAFPRQFAGVKDSSADAAHARLLGERFGAELLVFNGNDRLFSLALASHAAGCITALANLLAADLRRVWDANQRGESGEATQARLTAARAVLERYPPAPPLLKALLARQGRFPLWPVRLPLQPLPETLAVQAAIEFDAALGTSPSHDC